LTEQVVNLTGKATELAEQSGKSLAGIVSIAEHAVGEVLKVSEEMAEQSRIGSAIVGAMRNISGMARETSRNMNESADFVTALSELSGRLKTLVESMGSDRRRAERFSLDSLCMITIEGVDIVQRSCRVVDIATRGLRIELRDFKQDMVKPGTTVHIVKADPPLSDVLYDTTAVVYWQDGIFCGLEFTRPIAESGNDLAILLTSIGKHW
jgi:hypothetical protein